MTARERIDRVLARAALPTLVAVMATTGLVAPAAEVPDPVVDSKVHVIDRAAVRSGASTAVDTDLPTEAVAVEWDGSTEGAVEVRAEVDGGWQEWVRLEGNPLEGPDRGSREFRHRTSAGPAWIGRGVRKVEVRVVEGDVPNLRLHAIRSEQPAPRRGAKPAGGLVPRPGIISRAAWGANESFRSIAPGCNGRPEYADAVRFAAVHHTVNANNYAAADGAALVRAIYYFHTHDNQWCDIGYHMLVDRYGQVFEGRFGGLTNPVIGAHAQGFNVGSTSVALIGTFQNESPPPVMYSSLRSVLSWKLAYHGIDPRSSVSAGGRSVPALAGHRDLGATACPGDRVYSLLPQLRNEVATAIQQSIEKPAVDRSATFYLRNWQTPGGANTSFVFGNPGDIPLFCDWTGRGRRTVGLFRPGTATFYLRFANSTGPADAAFAYGVPGDRPVCGDWNGDGVDSVGIVRNGAFYLRQTNTPGGADLTFGYGDPGDIPLAGDWNGDGVDTPAVVRSARFYLRNSNTTGGGDLSIHFGDPTDKPMAGDWNGDGVDTPGLFRQGAWYFRNSNSNGGSDVSFTYGIAADVPASWS